MVKLYAQILIYKNRRINNISWSFKNNYFEFSSVKFRYLNAGKLDGAYFTENNL